MRAREEEQAKLSNIETSTAALAHLTTFHERPRHTSSNRLGTASLIARDMGCSHHLSLCLRREPHADARRQPPVCVIRSASRFDLSLGRHSNLASFLNSESSARP